MKKLTAMLLGAAGALVFAGKVWAVNPDTILIRVTPVGTRSVVINTAEYNFGNQDLGTSTMTLSAIDVENDGNLLNTYDLELDLAGGTGTTWTEAAAAGDDVFSMQALFNTASPVIGDFGADDRVTTAPTTSTNTGVYQGTQSGVNVPAAAANDNRNLWLKLDMPTTSSVTAEQQFNLVVTAN